MDVGIEGGEAKGMQTSKQEGRGREMINALITHKLIML